MKDRIREIRKANGLTQEAFAERLCMTRNYITQLEMGAKEPGDRTIRDICREFGVNELWLRTGEGNMYAEQSRQQEMSRLVRDLMADSPESFRVALVTTLLRFDPDGPEWEILERIYHSIEKELDHE